jgi:hypothetical protein
MKIRGLDGLTPADLQAQLDNGARFVAFQWCVSLLVVTFRRTSDIYFVRPGQSAFGPNFLWSALTLVMGWWGFPWGPIYSIACLFNNLRGGVDLTNELTPQLLPPRPEGSSPASTTPALREGMRPARRPAFSLAPVAALAAAAAIVFLGFSVVEFAARQNTPVALVNGLESAYVATVNGNAHELAPHSVTRLSMPAGAFEVSARLPGGAGETRFSFSTGDDEADLFHRNVVIINPDTAAIVVGETVYYGSSAPKALTEAKPDLHHGRPFYVLPAPDFFLTEFPKSVQVSSVSGYATRNRIYPLEKLSFRQNASVLEQTVNRAAMVSYLMGLGKMLPGSEEVTDLADDLLKPDEVQAFYAQHLDTRPVLIDWHRAYQTYVAYHLPEIDLSGHYRRLAEADPDDGALAYLCGRAIDDPADSHAWYERALGAKRPCGYGHLGRAFDALGRCDFAATIACLDAAAAAGVDTRSTQHARVEALLGLGRAEEAARLTEGPAMVRNADYGNVSQHVRLASVARGRDAALSAIQRYLKNLPAELGDAATTRQALEGELAYARGEAKALYASMPPDAAPAIRFVQSLCQADLARAEAALNELSPKISFNWLLLYLEAHRQGSTKGDDYWKNAIEALGHEDRTHRRLAAHLRGEKPMTLDALLNGATFLVEKRVLLAALGAHDPANRDAFFARARQCDLDPAFPHHLVAAVVGQ